MMGFVTVEKGNTMTNAEKFVHLFGLYATELWSKSEKDFLVWLNAEYENIHDSNIGELIYRQAAIDTLMEILDRPNHAEFLYTDEICGVLWNLPSVPRRGKWIKDIERFGDNAYHCSQCGAVLEKDDLEWRNNYYCYHCGAKMEDNKDE